MSTISEGLRVQVFGNGNYLKNKRLISPTGQEIERNLLNVEKVWCGRISSVAKNKNIIFVKSLHSPVFLHQ